MLGIDDAIAEGLKIINKFVPDSQEREKAEAEYRSAVLAADVQREKISADDRDSARKMQIETHSWVPAILAGIVIVSAFCIIAYVLSGKVALTGEQGLIVGTIIGGVMGYVTQVLNYYFGSTSSSKSKDATIQHMMSSKP